MMRCSKTVCCEGGQEHIAGCRLESYRRGGFIAPLSHEQLGLTSAEKKDWVFAYRVFHMLGAYREIEQPHVLLAKTWRELASLAERTTR